MQKVRKGKLKLVPAYIYTYHTLKIRIIYENEKFFTITFPYLKM